MKYRLLAATIITALSVNANANLNNNNNIPDKCPSVSAIQGVSLTNVSRFEDNNLGSIYAGFQYGNKYDTQVPWDFAVVIPATSNNVNNATSKLTDTLGDLSLLLGPIGNTEGYACLYYSTSNNEALAAAVKPGMLNQNTLNNLKLNHKL